MAQRLLVLETRRLGDALMSLPFLRGADRAGWEVYMACSSFAAPLYEMVLPPERIVTVSRNLTSFRALRAIGAEAAVSVWADVRDHLLLRALGIPRRVGLPMNEQNYYARHLDWRRRGLRNGRAVQTLCGLAGLKLLTDPLQRNDYQQHHMDDWAQLALALGFTADASPPWMDLPEGSLPNEVERFFTRNQGKKIWFLHPGAGKDCRKWPDYARVVKEVFARHDVPLFILQPPDCPEIPTFHENALRWPTGSLEDFLRLVSRCDYVLCNDTSAAHVAAAFGKRVLTVSGPTSKNWFGPYVPEERRRIFESFICPVRPCYDRCVQPSYICLEATTYDMVARGIEETLFPA
jgi:ADP-heptose:LPS heptosyltransferase